MHKTHKSWRSGTISNKATECFQKFKDVVEHNPAAKVAVAAAILGAGAAVVFGTAKLVDKLKNRN